MTHLKKNPTKSAAQNRKATGTFAEALTFMPLHRAQKNRSARLGLDQLFDEYRWMNEISPSVLDLVLMGYRYGNFIEEIKKGFLNKSLKPKELNDLFWIMGAAILTRSNTPAPLIVNEAVECAKNVFGENFAPLVNAFGRHMAREKDALLNSLKENPLKILPTALIERWHKKPQLAQRFAHMLSERPAAGVHAFSNSSSDLEILSFEDFQHHRKTGEKLQAMDAGSWDFCQWLATKTTLANIETFKMLDTCAAPGGKLIALRKIFLQNSPALKFHILATDSKERRLERLRENLAHWDLAIDENLKVEIKDWSTDVADPQNLQGAPTRWNLVLADLPCSGSGTLHTRPDLLTIDLDERVKSLKDLQANILKQILEFTSFDQLCVSLCSVDIDECAHVSKILGVKPQYQSFDRLPGPIEGITAWLVRR